MLPKELRKHFYQRGWLAACHPDTAGLPHSCRSEGVFSLTIVKESQALNMIWWVYTVSLFGHKHHYKVELSTICTMKELWGKFLRISSYILFALWQHQQMPAPDTLSYVNRITSNQKEHVTILRKSKFKLKGLMCKISRSLLAYNENNKQTKL